MYLSRLRTEYSSVLSQYLYPNPSEMLIQPKPHRPMAKKINTVMIYPTILPGMCNL